MSCACWCFGVCVHVCVCVCLLTRKRSCVFMRMQMHGMSTRHSPTFTVHVVLPPIHGSMTLGDLACHQYIMSWCWKGYIPGRVASPYNEPCRSMKGLRPLQAIVACNKQGRVAQ